MGYMCPICKNEMVWDSDVDAEDIGYDTPGIVTFCHCNYCNASVDIYIPLEEEQ